MSAAEAKRRRNALLLALGVAALLCALAALHRLDPVEGTLLDLCFAVRGPRAPSPAVALVAIDDATLRAYPQLLDSGPLLADLLARVRAAGACVVVLDLPSLTFRPPRDLAALAAELARQRAVVLPAEVGAVEEGAAVPPLPPAALRFSTGRGQIAKPRSLGRGALGLPPAELLAEATGLGVLNVFLDTDGAVRAVPLLVAVDQQVFPSLALEAVRLYYGKRTADLRFRPGRLVSFGSGAAPVDAASEMQVNFAGPYGAFVPVSGRRLLEAPSGDDRLHLRLQDRLVIIGASAPGSAAALRTPTAPAMPGAEVQANAIATIISGRFLPTPPLWLACLATLALTTLLGVLMPRLRPLGAGVVAAATFIVVAVGTALLFRANIRVPLAGPLLGTGGCGALLWVYIVVEAEIARAESARAMLRLDALAGVEHLVGSALSRQELLEGIMRWVERELECEAASLLLLDAERRHLEFEVALGPKGPEVKDVAPLRLGEGIAGTVAGSGEPLLVPDVAADQRWASHFDVATGFRTRSILAVPMRRHGEVVGVLEVINRRGGGAFTPHDASLLSVIAQQAAMFLENARLYALLERRVELANEDLRTANASLAAEKARIEALVNHMADGVLGLDEEGHAVLCNAAAAAMLGLPADCTDDTAEAVRLAQPELWAAIAQGPTEGHAQQELVVHRPDQELILRVQVAPVADEGGGVGRVAVLTDITQLRELDRMKTRMVSFVSHELRNPLSTIRTYAALIRRKSEADAASSAAEAAAAILRQADRMGLMVEDFLDVTRLDMGRPLEMHWQPIEDVRGLIMEAVEAEAASTDRHRFEVWVGPDVSPLAADPGKLRQILANLVNNAVKYSPDGGTITVRARRDGDVCTFSVEDQGLGIALESQGQLFQAFRRVEDGGAHRVTGTGLGLLLTKHLVEAHGGRVWVESEEGQGSTFRFEIPDRVTGCHAEQGPPH